MMTGGYIMAQENLKNEYTCYDADNGENDPPSLDLEHEYVFVKNTKILGGYPSLESRWRKKT
jgi:hypothetical protein